MFINADGFLSILILLLLVGLGFFVFRRLFGPRHQPYPYQMNIPPQQRYGPQQGYGPPSDYPPGYGRPYYGSSYPQQGYPSQGGINPWVAGGLGALGGGLVGYELGQAMADNEQLSPEGALASAESNFEGMPP